MGALRHIAEKKNRHRFCGHPPLVSNSDGSPTSDVRALAPIAERAPFAGGDTLAARADGPDSPASWLGAYEVEGILRAGDREHGTGSFLRLGVPYAVVAVVPLQDV